MTQAEEGVFDLLLETHSGKPNILVLSEYVNATYFISFDAPLRAMHARGELNFAVASQSRVEKLGKSAWAKMSAAFRPDLIVFTRFGLPSGVDLLHQAKATRIPVVYHIDDDLLDLAPALGHDINKRNGSWAVKEARRQMLAEADLIYASTAVLARRMESRFPGQRVFHGIYAAYPGDLGPPAALEGGIATIGYMGSKGHLEDLAMVVADIARLMDERPEVRFETFGTIRMPGELAGYEGRVTAHPVNKSYQGFLGDLAGLSWAVGLAPLVDEKFNRCKAPTKFVEYTAAGIPVVASDVKVYREVISSERGVLVDGDWKAAMEIVLDSPGRAAAMVGAARDYCRKSFSREVLEEQVRRMMALARDIQ